MAVALDGLDPAFKDKVEILLQSLKAAGVAMRPYTGLRTPQEQAILWRQSRSREEIAHAIERLNDGGAHFLAKVLNDVGPHHGMHVTNSLPGLSWHQWGEAVDCFWAVNGTAEWSNTKIIDGINGYKVYAERAKRSGLEPGGLWPNFKDWPHVQFRKEGSPTAAGMTFADIDKEMKTRFG